MVLQMARPHLRKSSRKAYYRCRLPADVKHRAAGTQFVVTLPPVNTDNHSRTVSAHAGKSEIKFSLGVSEPADVRVRHAAADLQMRTWFDSLRKNARALTTKQISALAGEIYKTFAETLEDDPVLTPEAWEAVAEANQDTLTGPVLALGIYATPQEAQDAARLAGLERSYGRLVDLTLAKHNIVTDELSRRKLLWHAGRAATEAARKLARNADGDYSPDKYVTRFPSLDELDPQSSELDFNLLFEEWRKESGANDSTARQWQRTFEEFVAFTKKRSASDVTRADVVNWKQHLLDAGLTPKTINDSKLAAVRAILAQGVRNGRLEINPAHGVSARRSKKPGEQMQGFTNAEAMAILQASQAETIPYRRWVPLLLAQSGARVGEICQLRGRDIAQENGIWCFEVKHDAGSVKTPSAERKVPLHSHVIQNGFLDFVGARGDGPLFYDTRRHSPSAGRAPQKIVAKNLAAWVRNLGLDVGLDKRKAPNHAWRHWFVTALREQGVDQSVIQAIIGHAPSSMTARYGSVPLKVMQKAVESVQLKQFVEEANNQSVSPRINSSRIG